MNCDEITSGRLAGWGKKLAESNATPLVLVGVGHGEHSGEVVVFIPENGPREAEIARLLRGVADKLSPPPKGAHGRAS